MEAVATEATVRSELHLEIREYLNRMFTEQTVEGDNGPNRIFPDSLTPERGAVLSAVCRAIRPRATLEVGMAWGVSTLLILEALAESGVPAAPHVVMDPGQSALYHNAARLSLKRLGLENFVEFYEAPSDLVLPSLLASGRQFDFAFIDGDHHFDTAFNDFRFANQLLVPGGTILFDDTWCDGVYLVSRFAETNFGYKPVNIACPMPMFHGRAALWAVRKPLEPVERGSWDAPIKPFFDDLIPTPPVLGAVPELLDNMAGECLATRIVMKGGHDGLVEAAADRVRETVRQIDEVVRVAETFAARATPETAAETHRLLDSVTRAFASAQEHRDPSQLERAAAALERLKTIFSHSTAPDVIASQSAA